MKITLPYCPSTNTYYRSIGRGRVLISEKGRLYRILIANIVRKMKDKKDIPYTGPLKVDVIAFPPDKRKRDCDNIFKSLLDSLEKAGVYYDDNQIKDLRVRMMKSCAPGRVEVDIEVIEGWCE